MFRRIILASCVLLFPLGLVVTASAAGASVAVPTGVAAHAAATTTAASQPLLRLGSRGRAAAGPPATPSFADAQPGAGVQDCCARVSTGRPRRRAVPASGTTRPNRVRMTVVLPAPFGPGRPTR